MLLLTYQRGALTGPEPRQDFVRSEQLQPCPFSLQMLPPMHTSSSMPSMLMGTGPSTLR